MKESLKSKRAYCDGPFGQIHYSAGVVGIPIILLHQSPTSSVQFDEVMGPLSLRGLRPIAMDIPGFGMSDTPDFIPTMEDYAKSVVALVDALNLDSYHILGHHMGSQVATEVAILDKRIKSLIVNSPLILSTEERRAWRDQIVPIEKQLSPESDGRHLLKIWNLRAQFSPGFDPIVMHKHIAENLRRLEKGWYGHNACFNYDQSDRIKLVQQPVMVFTNSGDFLADYAKRILEVMPGIRYEELSGGTLDIVDDQPEEWSDVISNFIINQES